MLLKLMVKERRCCGEKRGLIIECLASAELTSDRSCPTVIGSRDIRCHSGLWNSTASMREVTANNNYSTGKASSLL